jgi:NMD protein affecting ribosome stability and mRNA decay
MQVTLQESVTRACCNPYKDLQQVHRSSYERSDIKFCVHCGRQWTIRRWSDAELKAENTVRILRNEPEVLMLMTTNKWAPEALEPQRFAWDTDHDIKSLLHRVWQHVKYTGDYAQVPEAWK